MSGKRSDIEVIDDDELVELVDDDGEEPTTVAPSPQPHGHRRATAPMVSLESPRATASHRKPTQPLFPTESTSIPEPLPRTSRQHPVVATPAPYYPPQAVAAPYPEPAYPQPVAAPYQEPYQEPAGPVTWDTQPQQDAWAGAGQPVQVPGWGPEQQPLPPMGGAKPRIAMHPAAIFGMVLGALAVGVGLAVLLLKPSAPPATVSAPEIVKAPAPVTVPLPTLPATRPTAAALPNPAVTIVADAPARPTTTTSGVRTRTPGSAKPPADLAESVAARLAAAQPEAAGSPKKPAPAEKPARAAEPSDEPAAEAKPEKKRARSADPFAEDDGSSAAAPEPKPEKKAKKWEDPFAGGE